MLDDAAQFNKTMDAVSAAAGDLSVEDAVELFLFLAADAMAQEAGGLDKSYALSRCSLLMAMYTFHCTQEQTPDNVTVQ